MLGFSDILKSNFRDSATTLTSLLEPRLKSGQDAASAPLPPQFFDTPLGGRRVPRDKDPKKPNYEMIKDARKGILSGFLRSGKLFRASDFVGIVNPKTAIITLHGIYQFETRYLAATDNQPIPQPPLSSMVPFKKVTDKGADDEKNLRNLFFITLAHDELPSFHFWTKPGDLDPVTAGNPIDWDKHFDENPPSPATTAKITMLENERKEKVQRGTEEHRNTQKSQPLGFLDGYNDANLPVSGREPTQSQPGDDINLIPRTSAAPVIVQPLLENEILLQFNRGGMYLREFTHKALYAMACWLIKNEEEDEEEEEEEDEDEDEEENARKVPSKIRDMFLDILEPGKEFREEKIVSVSRVSNRKFQENIKPIFGRQGNKFRIRSTRYQSWFNRDFGFDSGGLGDLMYDLKLVRPNVGYCYCSANWHITRDLKSNSRLFEKALIFLFDWESSAYPKPNRVTLNIPGHGSFELDRNSDLVVDANIQKIFAGLSSTPGKPVSHPVEIFVRDIVEDMTDGSDFLGTSSPINGNNRYEKDPGEVPEALQATEIRGGPDLPSIYPRLLTNSESNKLQERLKIAEASVFETEDLKERLRIAEEKLSEINGLRERLRTSEDRARLKSSCPFCPQDWAGSTKQQQQDHLQLHQKDIVHQPAPQRCPQPNCKSWLGENQKDSTHEAISEHLRSHIEEEHAEDGICDHPRCHTNMYTLTAEQQEEHESIHRDHEASEKERDWLQEVRGLGKTLQKPDRSEEQTRSLEDIAKERDQLQQQVRDLQNAANERDRLQKDLEDITKERDSFKACAVELERQLKAASDLGEGTQTKESEQVIEIDGEGSQMKEPEPETEADEDPKQPSQSEAPKRLQYCNVCLKSVDKLSANAQSKHADKCKTSVPELLLLTPAGAKAERERRNNSHDVIRPQPQQGTVEEEEVPSKGKKRKEEASARVAPSESQQDEAEDANTAAQPEASKATGRKKAKHKIDAFKPPREDESDEDLESPRKKPRLKAKGAKADNKEIGPTRKSTRGRGKAVNEPAEDEENEDADADGEEADKPSSPAKGGKRKKSVAAVTKASKKAKTKK